jgi:hypothetical protein
MRPVMDRTRGYSELGARRLAEWDEDKHPRDDKGRFGTDGGVKVVHAHANGFVTDSGGEQVVTDAKTGEHITTLQRYGVWKDRGDGKHEVVHVTSDLDEAKRVAGARKGGGADEHSADGAVRAHFEAKTNPLSAKARFGDQVVALVNGKVVAGHIARPGGKAGTFGIKQADGTIVDIAKADLRMPKGGFKDRRSEG